MRDDEFETFVRAHRPSLVRFATTLTGGDEHLAEDLVQAALVRIYLARPAQLTNAYSYARRAITNGIIDLSRRPFMRRERSTIDVPERPVAEPIEAVDARLLAALAKLPVRMRAAVVLRHVEGLSVEETAQALRCSSGNVKSQTARGLEKLRLQLGALATSPHVERISDSGKEPTSCPTS